MEYKGYFAKVEFDDDADIFHGAVINLRDVITFEGETVKEIKQAFHDSIDDYLEFCAKRGDNPEKPYSGKFIVGRSRYAAVKNLKMVYNFQRCPIPGTTKTKGGIP